MPAAIPAIQSTPKAGEPQNQDVMRNCVGGRGAELAPQVITPFAVLEFWFLRNTVFRAESVKLPLQY